MRTDPPIKTVSSARILPCMTRSVPSPVTVHIPSSKGVSVSGHCVYSLIFDDGSGSVVEGGVSVGVSDDGSVGGSGSVVEGEISVGVFDGGSGSVMEGGISIGVSVDVFVGVSVGVSVAERHVVPTKQHRINNVRMILITQTHIEIVAKHLFFHRLFERK